MPNVTHRKGSHRYVLTYASDDDLTAICEAIIAMAERPELDFDIADALALAVAVTDQMVREELRGAAGGRPAKPAADADGAGLTPP